MRRSEYAGKVIVLCCRESDNLPRRLSTVAVILDVNSELSSSLQRTFELVGAGLIPFLSPKRNDENIKNMFGFFTRADNLVYRLIISLRLCV